MTNSRRSRKQKSNTKYIVVGVLVAIVVMVVFFASRNVTSTTEHISPSGYQERFVASNTPHVLIDVRTIAEYTEGHIHGSINIPVESLANRLNEIPDDQPIVVYCRSGNRSAQASQILGDAGFTNIYDLGGLISWTSQGFPIE